MIETKVLPTTKRSEQFSVQGLQTDSYGRPLHPWAEDIDLTDNTVLWQWGENAAADAIIFNADKPEVLLIQRPDGTWANPGGFVDPTDPNKAAAAAREAYEEAGVTVNPDTALPVFEGIVHDTRASKYSWVTTAAFLWRTSLNLDSITAGDDAQAITIASLADIREQSLSGSHNQLIEQAVNRYGTLTEKLHFYSKESQNTNTSGGHMNYSRYISKLPTGEVIFVKQFAPHQYTDNARAERSLQYLQKEAQLYKALPQYGFTGIPNAAYYNGTLAVAALTQQGGWLWRHPSINTPMHNQYIEDTLATLDNLSQIPVIVSPDNIKPSFVSFAEEGWDSYSSDSKQQVINKLYEYGCLVSSDDLSDAAYQLVDELDNLYTKFSATNHNQPLVMCHHDLRESNFAWHPQQGTKIVDWSWAGPGLANSDTTTFLIDLHKRGVNVANYMDKFNYDHALTMIGFWLMHSTWPGGDDDTVRFQQVHSAVAAYDLFKNFNSSSSNIA